MVEPLFQQPNLTRDFVLRALASKSRGIKSADYDRILEDIDSKENLYHWYRALASCVASISEVIHSDLLKISFQFDWGTSDEQAASAFAHLVENLVSFSSNYLNVTFRMLLRNLYPIAKRSSPTIQAPGTAATTTTADQSAYDDERTAIVSARSQAVLQHIVRMVPSSSTVLYPLVVSFFPHHLRHDAQTHQVYLQNLLELLEYCPVLRPRVLETITDRIIQLDVAIKLEDLPDEEDLMFEFDVDNTNNNNNTTNNKSNSSSPTLLTASNDSMQQQPAQHAPLTLQQQQQLLLKTSTGNNNNGARLAALTNTTTTTTTTTTTNTNTNTIITTNHTNNNNQISFTLPDEASNTLNAKDMPEMAEKLDRMMDILLNYIDTCTNHQMTDDIFQLLLRIFDSKILHTHKSKFTQFLIFYLCRVKTEYPEKFLGYLLNKMLDSTQHSLTRQTCACYIGSFISRAGFIPRDIVRRALAVEIQWLHEYLDKEEGKPAALDVEVHGLFYMLCQSVFYVLCFQYATLEDRPSILAYFRKLQLDRIITCKLNPLRFCLATIVSEFVRICESIGFECCAIVVHRNRTVVIPNRSAFGNHNHLDAFFPFDPYLLRSSSKRIQNLYKPWKSSNALPHSASPSSFHRSESSPNHSDRLDDDELDDEHRSQSSSYSQQSNQGGQSVASDMSGVSFGGRGSMPRNNADFEFHFQNSLEIS